MRKYVVVIAVATTLLLTLVAGCGSKATPASTTPAALPGTSTAGTAVRLVFTTQPFGASAGSAFTNQPVVTIQDADGNTVTGSTAPVTVAITSGAGAKGAVLSGTTTINAEKGVAVFTDLSIDLPGTFCTLTASSSGILSATSYLFSVMGVPTMLAFIVQPTASKAGTVLASHSVVMVEDANGNTVTNSTVPVTLAITSGTGTKGAILSGTLTVNAVNGMASFRDLSIDLTGFGYTLTATGANLQSATSVPFEVTK